MHEKIRYHLLNEMPLSGCTLTEIVGNRRVLIENHNGILKYTHNEICVRTKMGAICLEGKGLEITCISRERLIIVGAVYSVRFYAEGKTDAR